MGDWNQAALAEAGIVVVELSGDIDAERCDFFFSMLVDPIKKGCTKLIIDCERLDYITSLGLGMLLRVHARIRKVEGEAKISAAKPQISEVLRVVRLDQVLGVYPTVAAAADSFGSA